VQSSYKILLALYQVLNVPVVTNEISKIKFGQVSKVSQSEFIALNTINNPNQYLQNGFANVNIHIVKLSSGEDNHSRFQKLTDIIIPILDETQITTENGTFYFQIDDDKGIFDDPDRDGMSYYNLRIEFQTL
tara:strand:- start:618 stop:1013 length:396 start_codon:yes stop_codon:yes gene_type:complete